MKRFFGLVLLLVSVAFVSLGSAADMPAGTEQYYVAQGVFAELDIEREQCGVQDEVVNFACGQYKGDFASFQSAINAYVSENLPGLYLSRDWFNSGENGVRHYQSVAGSYFFVYSPNGSVTVTFTPRQ